MKFLLALTFVFTLSIFPAAALDSTGRTVQVLEAKYQLWCVGDARRAEDLLGVLPESPSIEEILVRADVKVTQSRVDEAVMDLAKQASERDLVSGGPILRRLYSMDPRLRLSFREGTDWWISMTRLLELQDQGLAIKEGVLFERRVDVENPDTLLSYRLHTLQGRGQVLGEFGFKINDDILQVNGTPVSDWGFQEAFALAARMASGMDLTIDVIPGGTGPAVTRTYHFRRDAEVIARHLNLDYPGKE